MSNWRDVVKLTPKCPDCGTPMEKIKANRQHFKFRGRKDSAYFKCPKCGHKEIL